MFFSPIARKRAAERRRQTIAARRADQGCACHGKDLLLCPNYRPVIFRTKVNGFIFRTKVNGFIYTAKLVSLGAQPIVPSATVRYSEFTHA